jgi:hypothetical protein
MTPMSIDQNIGIEDVDPLETSGSKWIGSIQGLGAI